jgi:DNA-binding transcriptional ArsR family regulator
MNKTMRASAETLLFKTLADPTRRALFERLSREGELTVGALTQRAGVSQPAEPRTIASPRAGLRRSPTGWRSTACSGASGSTSSKSC